MDNLLTLSNTHSPHYLKIMLKGQVLKIVGETARDVDPNMTRLEKFEVFCRVCDGLLQDGRISSAKHYAWTNPF